MNDQVLIAQTISLNISPLGFHRYASEFLRAAKGFQTTDAFSPVPYYLFSRAIELALKAFLLAKKVPEKHLIKCISHDLEKALNKADSLGLRDIVEISCRYKDELKKANNYYALKGFEYFQVYRAVMRYPELPNLDVLSELASTLVSKLKQICVKSMDCPI